MKTFRGIILCFMLIIPAFGWTVSRSKITTEHFILIFEKDNEQWAQEIASFADDVYERLARLLENRPPIIKVVIHSDVDSANGSYYPVPEHLNLYITSPRDFFLGAKTENWLKALFTHELTHYISISYESGWLYELSRFFGPVLRPGAAVFQPGWVMEGITTYTETRFTEGGRGRNPYFEMIYRAQIMENSMPSLKQAAYSPYVQPYGRIYVQGYMMIDYLFRNYGDDVMARFYRQMGRNPFAPYNAIETVTGKPAEEVYRDMIRYYSERYAPLYRLPNGERFSRGTGTDYGRPVPTAGGIVSFQAASPRHPSRFVLLDPDTGKEKPIGFAAATGNNDYDALFDGSRILYSGYEINRAVEGETHYTADLFELNTRTGKSKRITKSEHLFQPAYIDSESAVAVKTEGPFSYLVSVSLKSGKTETLFREERTNVFYPAVSPCGTKVAFTYNNEGFQCIAVLNRNSGIVELLTVDNTGSLYYPDFDRNGTLYFVSDGNGSLELYEYSDGQYAFRQVTDRIAVLNGIRYGNRFYYQSYASDGYVLKSVPVSLAHRESHPISVIPHAPTGSPSGRETAHQTDAVRFRTEKYIDAAQFAGWTPLPFNYSPVPGMEAPLGMGFLLYAQSVVKNDSVFFMTTFPFTVFQPSVTLNAGFEWGPLDFIYRLNQGYNSILTDTGDTVYRQKTSQTFSVSIPLYNRNIGTELWMAELNAGLTWNYLMEAATPFHLFDMGSNIIGSVLQQHQLLSNQGIHFQYSWNSGFRGYPDLGQYIYAGFSSSVLLPTGTKNKTVYLGVLAVKGQIPLTGAHSLFSEIAFSSSNTTGQSHQILLRGFSYEDPNTTAALSGTFGYRFPIAVVDAPLFATLALHSFSGALFTQLYANFNTETDAASFGNFVYLGGELNIQVGFAQARFPVQVGISCRIPTTAERTFDIRSDLKPYFSVDVASFLSGFENRIREAVLTNEPEI